MKRALLAALALVVMAGGVSALLLIPARSPAQKVDVPIPVKDLRKVSAPAVGELAVVGVVSSPNTSTGTMGLVDESEYGCCADGACRTFTLPVRWTGEMPKEGEKVVARGTIEPSPAGLVFVADRLERP